MYAFIQVTKPAGLHARAAEQEPCDAAAAAAVGHSLSHRHPYIWLPAVT